MSRGPGPAITAFLVASLAAAPVALADPVADFYKGRTITFLVGSETGGDYDVWARLLTRHWGRHIPGNPSFVVQNMPGAGGIRASNQLFNIAPRDGGYIGMTSRNVAYKALVGETGVMYDPLKFGWIGSPETTSRVCVFSSVAPAQKMADIFTTETIMAGAGAGTALSTVPPLLNRLLGAKTRLVEGYAGAQAAKLAIDRGEVHGLCQSLTQILRSYGQDVEAGRLRILFSMERDPTPGLDAPSIFEHTTTDAQRQVLQLFSMGVQIGRPVFTPPGVPADRLAALRAGFAAALADPALREEARKQGLQIDHVTAERMTGMVEELMRTPVEIRELAGKLGD